MALGWNRAEDPQIHFPTYLSILTAVVLSAWLQRRFTDRDGFWARLLRFFRGLYPVMLFGYFFISGHSVNRIIFGDWIDPFFRDIDQAIFGYLPSLEWGKRYAHWAVSELFHFAYFCYYPMIGGLPVYLYFRNRKAFSELIFTLTFTFYLCYWLYSLLPVIGGRFIPEAMELTKVVQGGPFTRIMALIYTYSAHLGGAFPSSHIGVTIVLTIAALKHTRKMGYVFVVIAFFLSLATVYCHYHWFIDAVAGVFIGIIGHFLALWVLSKLQGGQR
jgi:membrane-associated phospholipid phosphatase